MNNVLTFSNKHKLLMLIVLYFVFRMIHLTRLPVFNDEAIYLDWGWRQIHYPGMLYYSLVDGKQPLLMWFFGISQSIFSDPLFAGRIVSVTCGLFTLVGIYRIANTYYSQKIALVSSVFYILIPIFSSYDRLALMESAISACGIWSLFLLLRLIDTCRVKYAVLLGLVLGVGYFVKSSMVLFGVVSITILLFEAYNNSKLRQHLFKILPTLFVTSVTINLPLFFQSLFWQTLPMNSRYALTISELIKFPIGHFLQNLLGNIIIMFVFTNPLIFIFALLGLFLTIKKKSSNMNIAIWFGVLLLIQSLIVRGTSQRYLVSFLPILVIFASTYIVSFRKTIRYAILTVTILIMSIALVMQLVNPILYIQLTGKITKYADKGFIEGQTSGIGIQSIVDKINAYGNGQPLVVATALNIGNPESAVRAYLNNSNTIRLGYLDRRMFGEELNNYQCINPTVPFIYISRDYQQSEMNEYLKEIDRVHHPFSDYSLGVYTFKSCNEKFVDFNPYLLTQ